MKKLQQLLILTILGLAFISCANSEPKIVYITKTKTQFLQLPNRYYNDDITIPRPPNQKAYLLAGPIRREVMNANLILDLYKTIGLYKIKLKAIRDYEENMKQGIKKIDKEEK